MNDDLLTWKCEKKAALVMFLLFKSLTTLWKKQLDSHYKNLIWLHMFKLGGVTELRGGGGHNLPSLDRK